MRGGRGFFRVNSSNDPSKYLDGERGVGEAEAEQKQSYVGRRRTRERFEETHNTSSTSTPLNHNSPHIKAPIIPFLNPTQTSPTTHQPSTPILGEQKKFLSAPP